MIMNLPRVTAFAGRVISETEPWMAEPGAIEGVL
jgi:hypothetical protein